MLYFLTPRCPREVRECLGLPRKTMESRVRRWAARGVLVCVTPSLRQARLYVLSPQARVTVLLHTDRLQTVHDGGRNPHDWAWLCAGAYRRVVLRRLTEPLSTRALRKRVIAQHPRTSLVHVQHTLRGFLARGLAERESNGRWHLTKDGAAWQQYQLPVAERLAPPSAPGPTEAFTDPHYG